MSDATLITTAMATHLPAVNEPLNIFHLHDTICTKLSKAIQVSPGAIQHIPGVLYRLLVDVISDCVKTELITQPVWADDTMLVCITPPLSLTLLQCAHSHLILLLQNIFSDHGHYRGVYLNDTCLGTAGMKDAIEFMMF